MRRVLCALAAAGVATVALAGMPALAYAVPTYGPAVHADDDGDDDDGDDGGCFLIFCDDED